MNKILQLPVATPSAGLLTETGIWSAKERIEYSTLMLIYSIMNSNKERISQTIILEQKKNGMPNPLYERAKEIVESIVMNIDPQKKKKKKMLENQNGKEK